MVHASVTALPDARFTAATRYQKSVSDIPEVLALAADACQAPMAALKVVGGVGAHFAATLGMNEPVDVPKSLSLCHMVSDADNTMVVDDAARDPRLADHPLVAGSAHVSFVGAAPLHYDGHIVGALCVFDNEPRRIDGAVTRRLLERIARRIDSETGLRDVLMSQPFPVALDQEEIVSAISHEIRTPLASIQGNLELLMGMPGAIAPRFVRQVDAISRNADRLTRTVDNLLRAVNHQSHAPVGAPGVVDLTAVVCTLVDKVGKIVINAPREPVLALADERLVGIAIGHLLSNAIAHGAPESPVVITVTGGPRPTLEVRDQGPGLDASELARLGTPFYRGSDALREQAPGLGLGLAITRRIVEAQGGELYLDSRPGMGLTARVVLTGGTFGPDMALDRA